MTGKDLYRAVGQIEDELILGANEEPTKRSKPPVRLWALAAAACLCLVCLGGYRHLFRTSIVWNETPGASGVSSSKVRIPEGSVPLELTKAEAEDYYQIGAFPAALGQELRLAGQDQFYLYTDAGGEPVYDRIELWYSGPGGSASVGVFLSRVSAPDMPREGLSRIKGTSIYLTAWSEVPQYPVYTAQWERNGTTISVTGNGMEQAEFIALVEELLTPGGKESR